MSGLTAEPPSTEPFERIDEAVCGGRAAPPEIADRARRLQTAVGANEPLCLRIARTLLGRPGARIALLTGFVVPGRYPVGENDGPLGAAVLTRSLLRAGFRPTVYADPEVVETMRWLLAEIGANAAAEAIPTDGGVDPGTIDIAIAIEKPGANTEGVMHTFDGERIEAGSRSVDRLFHELAVRGKLTIGIGDQGNEIGFGLLGERLSKVHPDIGRCSCGCGGSIAAATATDLLYPAAVSNWGAYGLAAAIALLSNRLDCTPTPKEERRLLLVAAVRGCCDGARRRGTYGVDGITGDTSVQVVRELREIVIEAVGSPTQSAPVHDPVESGNEALRE